MRDMGVISRPLPHRHGKYGIVAASQPLAARAGVQILERGGNAVDAAIATNAVMGLVEPQSNGIGGDLFAIVYDAKQDTLHGLNAGGWAPAGLTPALLRSQGITQMPGQGIHAVTVPGAVAGWEALRTKLGTLPMADWSDRRSCTRTKGFRIRRDRRALADAHRQARGRAERRSALPAERPRAAGRGAVSQSDLAGSLRRIARHGAAGFYEGATADAILGISRERGGTMTADDLRAFAPEWVAPISTNYRGWDVYELPPNTQGIAALMMLNVMEAFPLGEYGLHSARAMHVMIEAKKLAYADMLRYVGDPRFAETPVPAMLDKTHARARGARRSMRAERRRASSRPCSRA